jgi:uncharacterized repeat protein (TIGR01451 family)
MRKKFFGFIVAMVTVISIGVAAKTPDVTLESKQFKEVKKIDKKGHIVKVLEDIKKVIPGDIVVYQNVVSNFEKQPLKNLVLNNKIPTSTKYVKNSAKCSTKCELRFSNDGGKTFKLKAELNPKKPVTDVRWILLSSIDTNTKATVSYKTKVQ